MLRFVSILITLFTFTRISAQNEYNLGARNLSLAGSTITIADAVLEAISGCLVGLQQLMLGIPDGLRCSDDRGGGPSIGNQQE